jgi:multidrug efflux pump
LGGFSGILMQQFAVTIAISVLLSGVVALTLTPTLCAIFLRNVKHGEKHESKFKPLQWVYWFFDKFNAGFVKFQELYMTIVVKIIDNAKKAMIAWCIVILAVIVMFIKIPTGLVPLEDMGYYYDTIHVNSGGSIDYNVDEAISLSKDLMNHIPELDRIAILGGKDIVDNGSTKTNTSTLSIIMKDYALRPDADQDVDAVIKKTTELQSKHLRVTGFPYNQPPIRGMSTTGGVTFYLQAALPDIGTPQRIHDDGVKLAAYLQKEYPQVVGSAFQLYDVKTPEINVKVDPRKAYLYDVPYANIFNSLQSTFGLYYINYFTKWNDLWWVMIQSEYQYRNNPELLNVVYAKTSTGNKMIPVGSLATFEYTNGAELVTRMNDYIGSQIIVNPNPVTHASSGDVMNAIRDAVPKVLGKDYSIQWFGPSYMQNLAGNQAAIAFSLGLIMVFLILAALYEMWALPMAIMMALPFALLGAALTLLIFRMENNIYFQVSMLTLIGLSAKNAILIVEFAIEAVRNENMSYRTAAIHAAKVRFRPIIMTSIAFILGAIPLATATGAGANSQHSVGYGIIGGMLGSTLIATCFVPLFFIVVMNLSKKETT